MSQFLRIVAHNTKIKLRRLIIIHKKTVHISIFEPSFTDRLQAFAAIFNLKIVSLNCKLCRFLKLLADILS